MAAAGVQGVRPGRLRAALGAILRTALLVLLALTPVTAIVVLGWFTRKVAQDVRSRLDVGKSAPWPKLICSNDDQAPSSFLVRWGGGLYLNAKAGLQALIAVLVLTLPFTLAWLIGWFAGWENSFNKGYELSGIWPIVTLTAVLVSLPMWALLPMAIVHQAVTGRISGIFEFRQVASLVRAAGWRYMGLSLLIAIGQIGVFGVRALPVFAEHMSPAIAGGAPAAAAEFAQQFKFGMTVLLILGLLVVRRAMASVYAHALKRRSHGQPGDRFNFVLVLALVSALWLGAVFLIFAGQFLNYSWFAWINQPVLMLPWLMA